MRVWGGGDAASSKGQSPHPPANTRQHPPGRRRQIRKRLALEPEHALFFTVGTKALPPSSTLLGVLAEQYRDADGFLYIAYSSESVFG